MEQVKAERVNDFEKKEDSYDYKVSVTVKVKNKVFTISLYRSKDWQTKEYSTEVRVGSDIERQFDDFGIEADYSTIEAEYEALVETWIVERETERVAKAKAAYKKLWAHKAKKEIEELDSEVSVAVISKKDFLDEDICNKRLMTISYKGEDAVVRYEDVSRSYSRYSTNMKYVINNSLTEYKRRGYKKLSSLIKKFKELVNVAVERKAADKKAEKRKNNVKKMVEAIKVDGCKVTSEANYYVGYGTRNRRVYREDGYKLRISWEGGRVNSTTRDGKTFSLPTVKDTVDLDTLKRYVAHVKSFVA